ncbi:baculoviral IAP repeat-containing protein 5.2 [Hydra vulgaris]|uniref:Baculoviral IAP repeat-containing protein 5.2 n=1 Tax=Hydra vulgaris TaxID=6087 RepID=A0ABM4CEP5_HYDVU
MKEENNNLEFSMHMEKNRKATFVDWPYDDESCLCNSKNMAEAGFFRLKSENEPDLVKCFVCLKQLDGWEPEDDPWKEHKYHSSKCAFIKLNKKECDWTMDDFLKIEAERQKSRVRFHIEQQIEHYKQEAVKSREFIEKII